MENCRFLSHLPLCPYVIVKWSLVDMNEILWHAEDEAYILVGPINKHVHSSTVRPRATRP